MSDLRKLLASALTGSSMAESAIEETALDRILAMSHADRLGTLLWRLRLANDRSAFRPAVLLLSSRMARKHEPRSMREKVAECAIMEWLDDVCRPCWGRGNIVPKDAPVATHVCTTCNGTGRRRHSDAARARALAIGQDAAKKWEARFAKAHAVITAADRAVWYEVAEQLERTERRDRPGKKAADTGTNRGRLDLSSQEAAEAARNQPCTEQPSDGSVARADGAPGA